MAIILIAGLVSYLPAFRADFVWDDELLVTRNPLLQNLSGLTEIWSGGRTPDYFPLTNTVFWTEYHLFGQNPAAYHVVNVLLQSFNAVLVWMVLRQLGVPGAWLVGLIFGIHPVHVESVARISELKNVLSLFFALLSTLCFLKIDNGQQRNGAAAYLSLYCFLFWRCLRKRRSSSCQLSCCFANGGWIGSFQIRNGWQASAGN